MPCLIALDRSNYASQNRSHISSKISYLSNYAMIEISLEAKSFRCSTAEKKKCLGVECLSGGLSEWLTV